MGYLVPHGPGILKPMVSLVDSDSITGTVHWFSGTCERLSEPATNQRRFCPLPDVLSDAVNGWNLCLDADKIRLSGTEYEPLSERQRHPLYKQPAAEHSCNSNFAQNEKHYMDMYPDFFDNSDSYGRFPKKRSSNSMILAV